MTFLPNFFLETRLNCRKRVNGLFTSTLRCLSYLEDDVMGTQLTQLTHLSKSAVAKVAMGTSIAKCIGKLGQSIA